MTRLYTRTEHLRDEALELYLLNELGDGSGEEVEHHLDCCGYCQDQLEGVRKLVTRLRFGRG